MTAFFTEIRPLMSQGAAPQPNAVGTGPATGGQTDLFALLLGMTLTSSENALADAVSAFAHVPSGLSEQDLVWDSRGETHEQPVAPGGGTFVETDMLPDVQPMVADPLICALLAALPQPGAPADEDVTPGPAVLRTRVPSLACLTVPLPQLQFGPAALLSPDLSTGVAADTEAIAVPGSDAQSLTAPLAARISSTLHSGQPAPVWEPLPLSDPGLAIAFDATTDNGLRATAGPRITAHSVDASFFITQPQADMSESAFHVSSQSVTFAAVGNQNQVPADPLQLIGHPPLLVTSSGLEIPDAPLAPVICTLDRTVAAATSQNTMPTPAASPTSVWSAATWPAATPDVHTSVAAVRVDASVRQSTAPVAPIVQLAAQLGLADGFSLEVGESSQSPVPFAAISTVPQTGTSMPADLGPLPTIPMPATASAVVTVDTAIETVPTLPAAPPSPPVASDDECQVAAQSKPARHTEVCVPLDATPVRTRVVEPRQQVQTGDTLRPESDITSAPLNRNAAATPSPLPDTAPVSVVPTSVRQHASVRASVQAASASESPVQSHIAANAQVRPNATEPVVPSDDPARPAPSTPRSQSQAPAPVGPDTTAATQIRTDGQDVTANMPRTEPAAPIQTISQTTNTIAPPEPATHAETPEPTRFVIETPKPLPVPGRITVRLEPPELGAIRIDLTAGPRGIVGRMRFAFESARAAVERSFPELNKAHADAGVRVERFEIAGHTPVRETATVWVADDAGQNPLADRAPHGRPWAGSTGDPRERQTRDDGRRRSPETQTASLRTGGFQVLRAGQVNLLA